MTYEPMGKVARLVEAMRAAPNKAIWTRQEVAKVMEVDRMGQIPVHLATAIGHGVIFSNASRWQFSLQPFVESAATGAATPQASDQVTGYVPPQMVPPRPGSDRMPSSFTAGERVEVPVFVQRQAEVEVASPVASAAVLPEPAAAPSVAPVAESGEVAPQPVPFTFCRWHDGDIDVFGLQELEGGGHRITAAQWDRLKAEFAWTRPA